MTISNVVGIMTFVIFYPVIGHLYVSGRNMVTIIGSSISPQVKLLVAPERLFRENNQNHN